MYGRASPQGRGGGGGKSLGKGACANNYFAHFRCNVCLDFRRVCHRHKHTQTVFRTKIQQTLRLPTPHMTPSETSRTTTLQRNSHRITHRRTLHNCNTSQLIFTIATTHHTTPHNTTHLTPHSTTQHHTVHTTPHYTTCTSPHHTTPPLTTPHNNYKKPSLNTQKCAGAVWCVRVPNGGRYV